MEEDFRFEQYYNIAEFHLKITHIPTGLSESSGKLKANISYFKTKRELKAKLIKRIYEDKGNVVGRSNP